MQDGSFLGFVRPNGEVGVRNHLLVLSIAGLTGPAARRVAQALPGSRLVCMPFGGGLVGADQAQHLRTLAGFGLNPNAGAVLLLGSGPRHSHGGACTHRELAQPAWAKHGGQRLRGQAPASSALRAAG